MGGGESPQGRRAAIMAETFDIVFKGGTVVNQAGEGTADPQGDPSEPAKDLAIG